MAPYLRPRRSGGQGSARSRSANHLYYSMTSLLSHLRTHLARTHLLGEPGVALVAVSGGADSVALLDLLHTLTRSEEHTSELQSHSDLVCRLLLEKKKTKQKAAPQREQGTHCHK